MALMQGTPSDAAGGGKYEVSYPGSFACVNVKLSGGDKVKAMGGSMLVMSQEADLAVELEGGCSGCLLRSCCPTGQKIFITIFKQKEGETADATVMLAPGYPGDIAIVEATEEKGWMIACGNYLASDQTVDVHPELQGCLQCCCGGEGLFRLRTSGTGAIVITSFGSIMKHELGEGEKLKVDNGFIVAWSANLDYNVQLAAGCCTAMCSGEGFVCTFTGPGIVYTQTRTLARFAKLLQPYIKPPDEPK